jgi:D-3-phosphoglycerate dehydrogenase
MRTRLESGKLAIYRGSLIRRRSKTQLTAEVLKCAKNLLVIGCFCIGTNQVDLDYAATRGVRSIDTFMGELMADCRVQFAI